MKTAATIALVCTTALSCACGALHAAAPSGCTSIQGVAPIFGGIQFGAAIVGIFTNYSGNGDGCADCHTTNGGTTAPTGDLDLDPADSPSPYRNLINVQSPWYPGYAYVVPNHPEQSLLFMKMDCDNPGAGARMPLDNYAGGLTVQQIALIYDWIAEGAPAGTTDGVFRNGFDIRGFAQ
ncbi:MAG TPA: c-type cytochrome [Rudaea sp.]